MDPSFAGEGWELESAVERAAASPATFLIPPAAERELARPGTQVKLLFLIETTDEKGLALLQGERMWVTVLAAHDGGLYRGRLESRPLTEGTLAPGAVIDFHADHIAGIARPPLGLDWLRASLALAASIWVDQRQYRGRIRPLLRSPDAPRQIRWQAVTGGGLLALALAGGGLAAGQAAGLPARWGWAGLALAVLLAALLAATARRGAEAAAVTFVAHAPGVALLAALAALLFERILLLDAAPAAERLVWLGLIGVGYGVILGLGVGLAFALRHDRIERERGAQNIVLGALGALLAWGLFVLLKSPAPPPGLIVLAAMYAGSGAGIYLGGWWGLRQLPPAERRQGPPDAA